MPNKNIFALPASGALVSTDEMEKQVTANGQNQKLTLAQMLTFIENNATAFTQGINFSGNIQNPAGSKWAINAATGGCGFASNAFNVDAAGNTAISSLDVGAANLTIAATGNLVTVEDVEISNTVKGFILKSPNGTRYRLKVDDAGNLGTEPA
jgi:hypothetical protein